MKGLLLKDWYQVRTSMKAMYLTVLAVLAIWILSTSGDSSFAVDYSAVFLGIMPAYLLSYDHASGWTEYSFALPLSKELQVAEKYLVGLLCAAAAVVIGGLFITVISLRTGTTPDKDALSLLAGSVCAILLINGIMLPLYYRFGAEKARMLYMLMFAGMGAALGGGTVLMDAVPEPGAAIAIVGVLAAVLVLYAVSWRVSVAWYGKYKK
jgi:ABC-2 type transport system permease protein